MIEKRTVGDELMIAVVAVCSEWKPGPWSSRVDEGGQVVLQDHHLGRAGSSGSGYFSDDWERVKSYFVCQAKD